jgi:hypothetical protein
MIVVRANLFSAQEQRARKKRPKLLIALAAAVLLAALLISDYSEWRSLGALRAQAQMSRSLAAQLEKDVEKARLARAEQEAAIRHRDAILGYAAKRQNWAPVMARALAAVPPNAELSRLAIQETTGGAFGLTIGGKTAGAQPRLDADKCMLQLEHAFVTAGLPVTSHFASLEDVPPPAGDARGYAVANFLIEFVPTEDSHAN